MRPTYSEELKRLSFSIKDANPLLSFGEVAKLLPINPPPSARTVNGWSMERHRIEAPRPEVIVPQYIKSEATTREDGNVPQSTSGNQPRIASTPPKITPGQTVLAIPDLHCPFHHQDALAFLCTVRDAYKTTLTVCLGDECDFAAFSRFPRDPDGMSAGKEMERAKEELIPFYREFPSVLVCTSNHTVRPMKLAFLSGLPEAFWPSYSTLLNAPDGWVWKDHWIIDGVRYFHGEGKSGQNAHVQFLKAYKTSVCHGHLHSYAAVSYEGALFAINSGCLIDNKAYAFKYARHMAIPVSLGCSVIIEGREAHFIPMHLDAAGRWTGKL